jgi:hypothetical protein
MIPYNKYTQLSLPLFENLIIQIAIEKAKEKMGGWCPECFNPWEVWVDNGDVIIRCDHIRNGDLRYARKPKIENRIILEWNNGPIP